MNKTTLINNTVYENDYKVIPNTYYHFSFRIESKTNKNIEGINFSRFCTLAKKSRKIVFENKKFIAMKCSIDHGRFSKMGLYDIFAKVDIPRYHVFAGDSGGTIAGPDTLSEDGDCWVGWGAIAYENARVSGNALVKASEISGNVRVSGDAIVHEGCTLKDYVHVLGNSKLAHVTEVSGNGNIYGNAKLFNATVSGRTNISGDVIAFGELKPGRYDGDKVYDKYGHSVRGSVKRKEYARHRIFMKRYHEEVFYFGDYLSDNIITPGYQSMGYK